MKRLSLYYQIRAQQRLQLVTNTNFIVMILLCKNPILLPLMPYKVHHKLPFHFAVLFLHSIRTWYAAVVILFLLFSIVRSNLTMHLSDTPFAIWQPIRRPCLLERVYKPICTWHWCGVLPLGAQEIGCK